MGTKLQKAGAWFGLRDIEPEEYDDSESEEMYDDDAQSPASIVDAPQINVNRPVSVSPSRAQLNRITTIKPQNYEDVQMIGRAVREGTPVILNLSEIDSQIACRIIDFASGLVFGLRGSIERITPKVFVLAPEKVSINEAMMGVAANKDYFGQ